MTANECKMLLETPRGRDLIRDVVQIIREAVKAEREACAALADRLEPLGGQGEVAAAIRARGQS